MRNLTEENVTEAVLASIANTSDPRLKEVMTSLIRHLHAFVREVEPSEQEWFRGIQFLTQIGQMCDEQRQEFILLSDILGVSILVDAINHRSPAGVTDSSVLGPFYREGAPELPMDAHIGGQGEGEPLLVSGQVRDEQGRPLAGALLDVWQTAPNGLYETQDENQPEYNLRGRFRTDSEGRYSFRTVMPVSYPVPTDGPVGKLLGALGRHAYRPAHIHFIVCAEGFEPVVTQLFVQGDQYLDSDVVFGVKNSLVVQAQREGEPSQAGEQRVAAPFYRIDYDFGLQAASAVPAPAPAAAEEA
jgi:hydroxyquinol 1,2-dioxygenase